MIRAITTGHLEALVRALAVSVVFHVGDIRDGAFNTHNQSVNERWLAPREAKEILAFGPRYCGGAESGGLCLFHAGRDFLLQIEELRENIVLDENVAIMTDETNSAMLSSLPLRLDSLALTYSENPGGLTINEWYSLPNGEIVSRKLLELSLNESAPPPEIRPMFERRRDLRGTALRVAALVQPYSASVLKDDGTYDGFIVDQAKVLAQATNFTVDFVMPEDGKWGSQNGDGSWNGMVGMAVGGSADLIIPLAVTKSREQAIAYTGTVSLSTFTLMTKGSLEASGSVNLWVFFNSFETRAWMAVFGLVCASTAFYSCILMLSLLEPERLLHFVEKGFQSVFLSLLQRGGGNMEDLSRQDKSNLYLTVRTASFALNIAFFLLFVMYCSDLTATMTAGATEPRVNSFEDIYREGYTLVYIKDSAEEGLLSSGKEDSFRSKVYKELGKGVSGGSELEQELAKGENVVAYGYVDRYLSAEEGFPVRPNLKFREPSYLPTAFGIPKNSSDLKQFFDFHIMKIAEHGAWRKIFDEWNRGRKPPDISNRIFGTEAFFPLGFSNLIFPVLLLAGGKILSCCFLALEAYVKAIAGKNRSQCQYAPS